MAYHTHVAHIQGAAHQENQHRASTCMLGSGHPDVFAFQGGARSVRQRDLQVRLATVNSVLVAWGYNDLLRTSWLLFWSAANSKKLCHSGSVPL